LKEKLGDAVVEALRTTGRPVVWAAGKTRALREWFVGAAEGLEGGRVRRAIERMRAAKPETKGSLFAAAMDGCTVVFAKRGALKHLAAALRGEFPESDVLLVVPKEAVHDFTAVRLRPDGRVDIHLRKGGDVLSWLPDAAPKNPFAPDFVKTAAVVRTRADGAEATRRRDADSLERALASVRKAFLSAQGTAREADPGSAGRAGVPAR